MDWRDIAGRVVAEIKADNLPVVAAGVAFYAWLALIPLAIALVMVYGFVAAVPRPSPSSSTSSRARCPRTSRRS